MDQNKKTTYKYCIVPKCKNTTRNAPDKVFFLVPRGTNKRRKWCKIMKRDMISPTTCLYCCEDHFNIEEDTDNYIQYKIMSVQENQKTLLRLKKGIVPHKFQCQKNKDMQPPPERKGSIKRKSMAVVKELLTSQSVDQSVSIQQSGTTDESSQNNNFHSKPIQSCHLYTDIANKNTNEAHCSPLLSSPSVEPKMFVDKAVQVHNKICYSSKGVNVNMFPKNGSGIEKTPISCKSTLYTDNPADASISFTQQSLLSASSFGIENSSPESSAKANSENDNIFRNQMQSSTVLAIEKNPKILLGLPERSYNLIQYLSDNVPLPTLDILITLKKLKLNESFAILAVQFGYSQSDISTIFSKSIPLIADLLKESIVWPSPEEIFKHMPISFKAKYDNIVSIIDFLEIQIEKPSNAVHQSLTWSQYRKCNTLKYLISYTPCGLVSFISVGYSGRATDLMVVEDCGFLDCLPPNTAVMADRGLKNISCLLENKKCNLIRPPSAFVVCTPSSKDIKQSKRKAALRNHVEQIIGRLREFHMLLPHASVDHNLIPVLDEIIVAACGLINAQNVLIK